MKEYSLWERFRAWLAYVIFPEPHSWYIEACEESERLQSQNAALLEALECNNDLLLTLSREALVREDYRCTVVADQIRDNYKAIQQTKEK